MSYHQKWPRTIELSITAADLVNNSDALEAVEREKQLHEIWSCEIRDDAGDKLSTLFVEWERKARVPHPSAGTDEER